MQDFRLEDEWVQPFVTKSKSEIGKCTVLIRLLVNQAEKRVRTLPRDLIYKVSFSLMGLLPNPPNMICKSKQVVCWHIKTRVVLVREGKLTSYSLKVAEQVDAVERQPRVIPSTSRKNITSPIKGQKL